MENLEQAMKTAVIEMKKNFDDYRTEFAKVAGVCDAFELQCKRLKAENDLFRTLLQSIQLKASDKDFDGIVRVMSGLRL